jgi:hypothetical protein
MPSRRVQGKFKFTFSVSVLSYYIRLSFKWPRFFWFTDQLLWLKQEIQKKFSGSDSGIDVVSGLLGTMYRKLQENTTEHNELLPNNTRN